MHRVWLLESLLDCNTLRQNLFERFQPLTKGYLATPKVYMNDDSSLSQSGNDSQAESIVVVSDAVVTPPPEAPLPGPVAFLRELFQLAPNGPQRLLRLQNVSGFITPTTTMIEDYSLPLVQTLREGNIPKLRDLIVRQGKSPNACNRFGESLLHMACRRGDVAVVKFLVQDAKARLDTRDDFGRTPLHDACWTAQPNLRVMNILIAAASPELLLAEDIRGHTPFHYARKEHEKVWMKFLQERKAYLKRKIALVSDFSCRTTLDTQSV